MQGEKVDQHARERNDETVRLTPPKVMTLEEAIGYVQEDELIEVTPGAVRLRKAELDAGREKEQRQESEQGVTSGRRDETRVVVQATRVSSMRYIATTRPRVTRVLRARPRPRPRPRPPRGRRSGRRSTRCSAGRQPGGNWCIAHANHCSAVMCPEHSLPARIFPSARVFAEDAASSPPARAPSVAGAPRCASAIGCRRAWAPP